MPRERGKKLKSHGLHVGLVGRLTNVRYARDFLSFAKSWGEPVGMLDFFVVEFIYVFLKQNCSHLWKALQKQLQFVLEPSLRSNPPRMSLQQCSDLGCRGGRQALSLLNCPNEFSRWKGSVALHKVKFGKRADEIGLTAPFSGAACCKFAHVCCICSKMFSRRDVPAFRRSTTFMMIAQNVSAVQVFDYRHQTKNVCLYDSGSY